MKNHYEILGISQAADTKTIKQAAEQKADEIKQIFSVLSNAEKRRAYDADSKSSPNYYDILAVNTDVTAAEIKEAAQARMNEIKIAFEVLSDSEKREAYDSELKEPSPAISANRANNDEQSPSPEIEISPYKPPSAPITEPSSEEQEFELAGRGTRLVAYFADGLVFIIPIFLIFAFAGFDALDNEDTFAVLIGLFVIVWVLGLFVINMVLLYRNGQTIGKRWLSIKIVRVDRSRAGLLRILFLRALPIALLTSIPIIGNLIFFIDALLIFQPSRRCLHDLFADTVVINTYRGPSKRGSTVVSIIVSLILIIFLVAILAAIAIPAYTEYQHRAKVTEAVSLLAALKTPTEEYIAANGQFPPSVESIDGATSGQYTDNVVSNPYDFYFQATLSREDTAIGGKTIRLTYDPSTKKWICTPGSPNGMDDKYLPMNCKQ
jgi:uncharacterized RDD family membrane protein YckC/Tfp pilus assembly major pilin PilA